jgi:glycosyltransferase involved in cell wall biosynthesis
MRYLLVAPEFGLRANGTTGPGGLQKLARCVARALASFRSIEQLTIWSQVEEGPAAGHIAALARALAHPGLRLEARSFAGQRGELARAAWRAIRRREHDRVMYLLVNQAVLANLPGHPAYDAWAIGVEVFQPLPWLKRRALARAGRRLSISRHTAETALRHNPGLGKAIVVHPGLEPGEDEPVAEAYQPGRRAPAVLIVGSMFRDMPYKGHRQIIQAWSEVTAHCPEAELWIVGGGDLQPDLEALAGRLPHRAARQVRFLGQLDEAALGECYRRCRAFAMPSTGEGFGLVFLEAARYGVPCIGGRRDAAREIICDGETGLLVEQEPAEIAAACLRLLTDGELGQRLGEAGRRRWRERFRFEHFRGRLLSALELSG